MNTDFPGSHYRPNRLPLIADKWREWDKNSETKERYRYPKSGDFKQKQRGKFSKTTFADTDIVTLKEGLS
jgi:hypothetical protein